MTSVVPSFDLRIATTSSCKMYSLKSYIFSISLGPETRMEAIEMVARGCSPYNPLPDPTVETK